jgi:hypothetical protein
MWGPLADQPVGGASQPHMLVTHGLLRWNALWSLLESSQVSTVETISIFLEGKIHRYDL